jgi:hypothetical protein
LSANIVAAIAASVFTAMGISSIAAVLHRRDGRVNAPFAAALRSRAIGFSRLR